MNGMKARVHRNGSTRRKNILDFWRSAKSVQATRRPKYGHFPSCVKESKYGCRTGPQRKHFSLGLKHSNIAIRIVSPARYEEKSSQWAFYISES